jgi:hypothetical protein
MERTNWHRLFGLLLTDFFAGSPFVVELEKDLSLKKQLLDVVVLRKRKGSFAGCLPDGFDNLSTHNLITFKSHQEALDDWALKELTGHYVNYRKQVSPSFEKLLPEDEFRLYAICSRHPQDLAGSAHWKPLQQGVFQYRRGSDIIRIVVLRQLPETDHNAVLHLLSALPEKVRYAVSHYRQRSIETSTLLDQLFEGYQREGVAMPYTMEDFRREYRLARFRELTTEQRREYLKDATPQERLEGLSPEEVLQILPREKIEEYLQRGKRDAVAPKKRKKKK